MTNEEMKVEQRKEQDKALVIVFCNVSYVLMYDVAHEIEEMLLADGGKTDGFALSETNIDHPEMMASGVWTVSVRIVDDGPGDWPGSRESVVQFYDERPATTQEWKAFCDGELPW